ncbi:MAG: alkaline phosphatase, partial [Acidobacteriota bacterium]
MMKTVLCSILACALGAGLATLWWSFFDPEDPTSAASLAWNRSAEPAARAEPAAEPVRNLVILIGDGMGFAHLDAARALSRGPMDFLTLERFPATGWSVTHSYDNLYTDSAAGATAISTGFRTRPGAVGVGPEGERLETLFEAARDAGKAVGVLTDSAFFDATPASFLAHRTSRRDSEGVVLDMIASGADVVLGETRESLETSEGWAKIEAQLAEGSVEVARSPEELEAAARGAAGRVFGLFPEGSIASEKGAPSLTELALWAVDRLEGREEGFV